MKKETKKVLGIPIAFFVAGILVIGGASAALVSYFARVTTNVGVEAPITLEDDLFELDGEVLNDGQNHYLLVKGQNHLDVEVPATAVITIKKNGAVVTDTTGIHLALDVGGDMHYCYEPDGHDMTNVNDCDTDYVQWLTNNAGWFDWIGTDATYESSGFVSPVINNEGNSWIDGSGMLVNGVMTIPGVDPDPGLIASLLVVRADFGLEPGTYTIEVEFQPVSE